MKKFLWITIISSVVAALGANGAPQPLGSPVASAQAECDCSKLKALQLELRNALRLQQAMRNKIPELRALDPTKSSTEYKRFTENDARRGLEPVPDYDKLSKADQAALSQFNFDVKGFALSDPTHPPREWTEERLCSLTTSAELAFTRVKELAACKGIAAALQAHEDVHTRTCLRGFVAFFNMNGAQRAQDEVDAYGAQIAVLRAEIAKVLEHANIRLETETTSRMEMPPNPLYTAIIVTNQAVVPMTGVPVSGEMIKLEGKGEQTNDAKVEGNCKFTAGLPFTLTARATIETDGLDAQIHFSVEGTHPSVGMECTTPAGTGHGMSIPVNVGGGNVPVINLPLENGAEKVFDQSAGPTAQMMAQSRVRITGTSKIRLIFCEK
jgi:hypothetical protein